MHSVRSFVSKVHLMSDGNVIEIRRLDVIKFQKFRTFKEFLDDIRAVIPTFKPSLYTVFHLDSEGDRVKVENESDFTLALEDSERSRVLRLFLVKKGQPSASENINFNQVHEAVTCDECKSNVKGFRYTCLHCENYDLCEKCEGKHVHPKHFMMRIPCHIPHEKYIKFWKKFQSLMSHWEKSVGSDDRGGDCSKDQCNCGYREKKCKRKCGKHSQNLNFFFCDNEDSAVKKEENHKKRHCITECVESLTNLLQQCEVFVNPNVTSIAGETRILSSCHEIQPLYYDLVRHAISSLMDPLADVLNFRRNNRCMANEGINSTDSNNDSAQTQTGENSGERNDPDVNVDHMSEKLAKQNITEEKKSEESNGDLENGSEQLVTNEEEKKNEIPKKETDQKKVEESQLYPTVPSSSKIESALEQMLAMGFSNAGGQLLQLLELEDGDIVRALDHIHPKSQ